MDTLWTKRLEVTQVEIKCTKMVLDFEDRLRSHFLRLDILYNLIALGRRYEGLLFYLISVLIIPGDFITFNILVAVFVFFYCVEFPLLPN